MTRVKFMVAATIGKNQNGAKMEQWSVTLLPIGKPRCNYYDEYLACEQEHFCERYIKFKGNWELLSGERLAIL